MQQERHDSPQENNSSEHSTERYPRQRQHNILKAEAANVVKTRDKMRDQDQDQDMLLDQIKFLDQDKLQ